MLCSHSCVSVWCYTRPRGRRGSSHCSLSTSIDVCNLVVSCCSVLDLWKAFDGGVHEAVMAYPSHVGSDSISRCARLKNFGFPPVVVLEFLRMNENRPPLLEEWGVSAKATRLIAALHSGSLLRYGECPSVAETRQGGRQGCKLGSTVFNVLYAEAVVRLQNMLLEEGFVARVVCHSQPFSSKGTLAHDINERGTEDTTSKRDIACHSTRCTFLDKHHVGQVTLQKPCPSACRNEQR